MAGYRRIKNAVAAENGETSIIVGREGLKVPSAVANLAAGPSARLFWSMSMPTGYVLDYPRWLHIWCHSFENTQMGKGFTR